MIHVKHIALSLVPGELSINMNNFLFLILMITAEERRVPWLGEESRPLLLLLFAVKGTPTPADPMNE